MGGRRSEEKRCCKDEYEDGGMGHKHPLEAAKVK